MADPRITLENRITIHGISIEITTIETTADVLSEARETGRLDHEYDVYLSDMDGRTMIVTPEGDVIDPYSGDEAVDLMELLEPILAHVPAWRVEQYVASRRSEEE